MTGEDLRLKFAEIAKRGFGHDHDAYLASTGKLFGGIVVDRSCKTHERLFGEPMGSVLGKQQHVSHAGYSVGAPGAPQGESADVLLLASEYLDDESKSELREALLLHEACHLIRNAGLQQLVVEDVDKHRAAEIRALLHPDDTCHGLDFLQQLSAATRQLRGSDGAEQHFRLAMSLDALFDSEVSNADLEGAD